MLVGAVSIASAQDQYPCADPSCEGGRRRRIRRRILHQYSRWNNSTFRLYGVYASEYDSDLLLRRQQDSSGVQKFGRAIGFKYDGSGLDERDEMLQLVLTSDWI